jgi:hypothetical protein
MASCQIVGLHEPLQRLMVRDEGKMHTMDIVAEDPGGPNSRQALSLVAAVVSLGSIE